MTPRTCCTCGQPITPSNSYLVTWTINHSGPPTNIYAHRGDCARIANQTYLTQPAPSPSISSIPAVLSGVHPSQPHQLPLLP